MRRSLLALVASLAVASASTLFTVDHQVQPQDVIGSFRRFGPVLLVCPFRIRHTETFSPGRSDIPHSAIVHNNKVACLPGKMDIFASAGAAIAAVNSQASKNLIRSFRNSGEPAIYGVEQSGRQCGSTSFSAGTVVIFFTPAADFFLTPTQVFPAGRRYMVIDDPMTPGVCQYGTAVRVIQTPEPPEPVDPTPTPAGDSGGSGSREPPSGTPGPDDDDNGDASGGGGGKGKGKEKDDDMEATPEPTESPEDDLEASPEDDDGAICFPADAQVETEDGTLKKISDVQIGDRLKVADGMFSDVFMFTHKDAAVVHDFVSLSTASGDKISATRGHYLYINSRFAAAVTAKVGDVLELGNGVRTAIKRVSIEQKTGLFNPQTVHGDIIVNSIRASTFTRTVEPATAQALLAPIRMMYEVLGWSTSFLDNGADSVAALLPKGRYSL